MRRCEFTVTNFNFEKQKRDTRPHLGQPRGAHMDANAGPGCSDTPGYCHLPSIHPLLYVGNEISPGIGHFDAVISTVVPRCAKTGRARPELSTAAVHFEDGRGSESYDEAKEAKRCILEGCAHVAEAIAAGKRTLVNCAWGQNRSGAICCAFAVLHAGTPPAEAISYVQARNLAERKYDWQHPPFGAMHNKAFCQIVHQIHDSKSEVKSIFKGA